jgi:hypothetical protein
MSDPTTAPPLGRVHLSLMLLVQMIAFFMGADIINRYVTPPYCVL